MNTDQNERVTCALRSAGVGTWDLDVVNQQVWWDDICRELYGFGPGEPVGYEQVVAGVHPADQPAVRQAVARALDPASQGHYDQQFRTVDAQSGQVRWLRSRGRAYFDAGGVAYRFSGTIQDDTAPMPAQREPMASAAQLQAIIDAAPAGIGLFVGRDLIVQKPNQMVIDIVGNGPAIVGKPLREVMPDRLTENQPLLQMLHDVYTSGTVYQRYGAPVSSVQDGVMTHAYYNVTYTPLRDQRGEVFAILDIAIDVTEEISLRHQIGNTHKTLQQAVDLAQLATWQLDIDNRVVYYNEHLSEWLGQADQATLPTFLNAIAPDDRLSVEAALQRACEPALNEPFDKIYELINPQTRQRRLVQSTGQIDYDEQGHPVWLTGISRDITQERGLQLALKQEVQQRTEELALVNKALSVSNEELSASNEEYASTNEELQEANALLLRLNENLQTFAYIASHDLQEPLRKIQQFGDILKTRYADPVSDEFAYLERMQQAASRMSSLIRDLLSFSRISMQRHADESVPLTQVVAEVLDMLDMAISETGAQVTVDPLPAVLGDSLQLGQLFQNLLTNALKFCRPATQPRVHVGARIMLLADLPPAIQPARRSDQYARIDVTDSGIGFDERYLDRIFQVFQRLHGRSQYSGTGIGLAICEKVVTNHGGAITATSKPDEGATFTVYLPL